MTNGPTANNRASWTAKIWEALYKLKDQEAVEKALRSAMRVQVEVNPKGTVPAVAYAVDGEPTEWIEDNWDDICTAMAWVSEALGVEDEDAAELDNGLADIDAYEERVRQLEAEGCTRSDAQAIVDAYGLEDMT
jgi:hypothetical protein